jgi:hypothetical protein
MIFLLKSVGKKMATLTFFIDAYIFLQILSYVKKLKIYTFARMNILIEDKK